MKKDEEMGKKEKAKTESRRSFIFLWWGGGDERTA